MAVEKRELDLSSESTPNESTSIEEREPWNHIAIAGELPTIAGTPIFSLPIHG